MPHCFALGRCCSWLLALAAAACVASSSPSSQLDSAWRADSSGFLTSAADDGVEAVWKPKIEVVFPAQHSWWQVSEATGRLKDVHVFFALRDFRIPVDGYLRVTGEKVNKRGAPKAFTVNVDVSSFVVSDFEPGSFFLTLELMQRSQPLVASDDKETDESLGAEHVVAQTTLHLEVVVPITSSPMLTYTPTDPYAPPPLRRVRLEDPRPRRSLDATAPPPTPICYVVTTKGGFDGQKKMWLQLMEALSSPQGSPEWTPSFRIEALTFDTSLPDSPVSHSLEKLGIQLKGGPQQVQLDDLEQANVSVDQLHSFVMDRFYAEFPEASSFAYGSAVHKRLSQQDQSRLANLKPTFVQKVWRTVIELLQVSCADGIVVMSNSRFSTDELVVNAARLAGARAVVMELANLFPKLMQVDALFAPSRFALRHPSVVSNLLADRSFAVSTGVNVDVFVPADVTSIEGKRDVDMANGTSFVVGYVGRLSTDKSVGVLVATARVLQRVCSFCKLRLIGDGVLKPHLKALAAEWGLLDSTVEFMDGIFNDEAALAAELRKMHVYATPALETLGISILEAMSTGLPVVGFIIGGTTEFLVHGYNCVGVHERSPEAFGDAIMALVRDRTFREELGKNARKTIEQRFSRDERIRDIAMLYQRLAK